MYTTASAMAPCSRASRTSASSGAVVPSMRLVNISCEEFTWLAETRLART